MMKKFLILIIVLVTACAPKIEKPDHLIQREKMVDILTDILIYKQTSQVVKNRSIDFNQINSAIFNKYAVTEDQFKESYSYYFIKENEFDAILEEVKVNLEANNPDSLDVAKFKKQEAKPKSSSKIKPESQE